MVEKGWNTLLPVDHLKKNLLIIPPKAKELHEMWKRACDTAAKCIAEAKAYNKQRWDKSHMEPEFREGDQVLVSTLSFNNIKGPKKMRDSFLGPFTIIKLIGKNAVDVKLTEESSRKHSLSIEFSQAIIPDRGGQIPLQEEEPHPTRNSGSGGFPWTCEENHQGQEDQT
ncbi:hypothetical protein O181_114977 [Austropuccinia psidii MF-1]|uniref:Uncharacterized protein n=1 Tax=Austropuccinia psidii MF-1 TaxID=1389203 RepID=A0A9Q3K6L2_9BASI|nr:hypothetical protein [Austropuccinia psidii MF-1]